MTTTMKSRAASAATLALFDDPPRPAREALGTGAFVLPGFALPFVDELLPAIRAVEADAPFRHLVTPGGFTMSVALTNCGVLGWTSDRRGYRYSATDPDSGRPWPAMPGPLARLAREAASAAGFDGFAPDACLVNRYAPGARLSLHQDKDDATTARPSSRCRWACRPCSCSAAMRAATRRRAYRSRTATWWSGAARTGCATTACCR